MAEKEHKEQKIGSQLPGESIKVIAESVGISGIPDDAASVLAEDSSYRLKQIVQVSSLPNITSIQILTFDLMYEGMQSKPTIAVNCMSSRIDHNQR